jgi:uncharacterized sporulation protein YeaH/YhbH (DUF444 family)
MPSRIHEDHKRFRDVISGRAREKLKHLRKTGSIVRMRPKGGKMIVALPQVDQPKFVHGDSNTGLGRGQGKEGDVIDRDPPPAEGSNGATSDPGEGIHIQIDMEDVLKFLADEIKLPPMKPKPTETFEETKIKYNNISKVGLNSLRHLRRTMKEAIKRKAMSGELEVLEKVPGSAIPIKVITPIKADFRYRQYREIQIPASNAVIFFARDCSGSMDDFRCEIVSDMSWWIDCWIRRFYEKVERCYFVHDTQAQEVTEDQFYRYRDGGGTMCSSAFNAIAEQLEHRFPPAKYNVYVFYFTDGDNWGGDNNKIVEIINEKLGPNVANLVAITQVCSNSYEESVKYAIDEALEQNSLPKNHVKTAYIGPGGETNSAGYGSALMSEEDRNQQIIEAIKKVLTPTVSK